MELCGPSGLHGDNWPGTDGKTPNQACCNCGGGMALESLCDSCTCTKGAYCTAYLGSAIDYIIPCPQGTYNQNEGEASADACIACSAGTVCATLGSMSDGKACTTGSFCPAGSVVESPCPSGSYCETPATIGTCSIPGTYCPEGTTSNGIPCSDGSYCPAGSSIESPCPAGHYCKTPSTITLCPAGTIAVKGSSTADACLPYDDFGSSCAAAVDLASIGSPYSGSTVGQPNDVSPSCYTSDSDAGEQIFFLDVPQGKIPLHS